MADFTTIPDFVFEELPRFKTLISTFENGYEQRRNKWSSDIREFHLVFKNRTDTEFETVRDFIIAKLGSYTSFTFENPNDTTEYTVRFKEDSLTFVRHSGEIYDFEFDLVEVRS